MEEGKSYEIKSVVTKFFNERKQVNLNKNSTVTEITDEKQYLSRLKPSQAGAHSLVLISTPRLLTKNVPLNNLHFLMKKTIDKYKAISAAMFVH